MSGNSSNDGFAIRSGPPAEEFMKHLPDTERDALDAVMRQAESDLKTAHAEICKLQNLDPEKHDWPAWSPQANTLRWFRDLRDKFNL